MSLLGAGMSLFVDLEEDARRRHFKATLDRRLEATHDTFALLEAFDGMWRDLGPELGMRRVRYVGVALWKLEAVGSRPPGLFDAGEDAVELRSLRLSRVLDQLNSRFGKDTVSVGPRPNLPEFVGAKIAFNRIPDEAEFWE
jgi:DNA polymerase IV